MGVCIANAMQAKSGINAVMWTPDGRRCMTGKIEHVI
jgi:hypothetical protein